MKTDRVIGNLIKVTLGLTVLTVGAFAYSKLSARIVQSSYDWEAAKAKLLRIGVALQKYRQTQTIKPIAERRSAADAGLPRSIYHTLIEVGKPWTINGADFKVENSRSFSPESPSYERLTSHFAFPYLGTKGENMTEEQKAVWSRRGEQMPLAIDRNMYSGREYFAAGTRTVLVLRLNGSVETVEVNPKWKWDEVLERL